MRTTVNLDPGAYTLVQAYAGGRGISLSAALNELVLRAKRALQPESPPGRLKENEYGYLEIAGTGHALTPEMVKAASEDGMVG